jgi:hypothetical protein
MGPQAMALEDAVEDRRVAHTLYDLRITPAVQAVAPSECAV